MDNSIQYTYNHGLGGYVIAFPEGPTPREIYKMFFDLYDTKLKGHRIFSTGGSDILGRHCKFHKRTGNKVFYEFTITERQRRS